MIVKPTYGHTNEDTAFLVESYPYGRLRCKIKFWVEFSNSKGFRFVSRTENPKTFKWNAPKKGTYHRLAGCLYLDEKDHIQFSALSEYSKPQEVLDFIKNFPEADLSSLSYWSISKRKMCKLTIDGVALISINGVPCMPTDQDKERATVELDIWEQCCKLLKVIL